MVGVYSCVGEMLSEERALNCTCLILSLIPVGRDMRGDGHDPLRPFGRTLRICSISYMQEPYVNDE